MIRPLRFSRRRFLQFGGIAALAAAVGSGGIAFLASPASTLAAVADTIVPADEFGPAASAVNAHTKILAQAQRSTRRYVFLCSTMLWLNAKAGGSFAALPEAGRFELLEHMAKGGAGLRKQKLFVWLRVETFRHYYGHAPFALKLGFVGAPQPDGHLDHDRPWTRAAQ